LQIHGKYSDRGIMLLSILLLALSQYCLSIIRVCFQC